VITYLHLPSANKFTVFFEKGDGSCQHLVGKCWRHLCDDVQGDTKTRELLKNPTKIEEIQEKKFIDRN
jgi:hypothetical protein